MYPESSEKKSDPIARREPDIQEAVGDQGGAHDGDEKADIFAKQLPARGRRDDWSRCSARYSVPHLHSITSSARTSMSRGTARPSILARRRLTTSSIFAGDCTGRSAGLAPVRMRWA